jgi:putative acyl-CoA dehydrogenase
VVALDVVRALAKQPETWEALRAELRGARGKDAAYDAYLDETDRLVDHPADREAQARRIAERLAITVQANLLMDRADDQVASIFLASRVGGDHGALFGTQPPTPGVESVARMAVPPA